MNWGKVPFIIRNTVRWLCKTDKLKIGSRDGVIGCYGQIGRAHV